MSPRTRTSALLLAMAIGLTGCAGQSAPRIKAIDAFVPEPVTDDMAGGFLTVRNTGGADDVLLSVSTDFAETVELHETVGAAMRTVASFSVPANGELKLSRGSDHLVFVGLKRKPVAGETVSLRLTFEKSDPIVLDVPVEAATHTGE